MQSIFFTRHGQSQANADHVVAGSSDSPLTEAGLIQAKDLADWALAQGMKFDIIVSSPLQRAAGTAKAIAHTLGYPAHEIIYKTELQERTCGDFEEGPIDDYYETPESVAVHEHGVESLEDLYTRATNCITWLQSEYPDKTILLVSHSGVGKMLRIVTEGRDASEFDKTISIPNATIMRLI